MHDLPLITTLTGGLAAALVLGYMAHRIGLSPIVGYLLAGIAVGPHTPGYVADPALAEQLAEIGVILLMFGVGLQFHLKELIAVRRVALPGAIGQSLIATLLGAVVAHLAGWSWTAGIVFGLAISVASTVVLIRVLSDFRALHTRAGHIAVGWLVVEDLLTVIVLVLLPAIFGAKGEAAPSLPVTLFFTSLKVAALLGLVFWGGGKLIPSLLEHIAATRSRELFTLAVLAVALGIAVVASRLFGVSMALGAFLAGMVVGRSDFSLRAASEALPMRDAFAVLFFVSIGMLLRPAEVLNSPGLVAAVLAIVLIGKPLSAFLIVMVLGYPLRIALSVSIALAQIGEFSFILAAIGRSLGILEPTATNALVVVAIISITINPFLFKRVGALEKWLSNQAWMARWLKAEAAMVSDEDRPPEDESPLAEHRAIVVGYGPIGRTVVRLLKENEIEPVVIEMNLETIRTLQAQGITAVYGSASHRDILIHAGVKNAHAFILSADFEDAKEVIRAARELNAGVRVFARANFVGDIPGLRDAGALAVFSGEGEVALAITAALLRDLGATPEQVERERERVQRELIEGKS